MQPPAYNRSTDFTDRTGDDTDHGAMNAEFDAAALSINETRYKLAIIQRDDGQLVNGIVSADALAPSAFDAVHVSINTARDRAETAAQSATIAATTSIRAKDIAVEAQDKALISQNASKLNADSAFFSANNAAISEANAASFAASANTCAIAAKNFITPTLNLYNGDDATTVFTLAVAPGNAYALIVAISGVVQSAGIDYTVDGTSLTFTSPPPVGDKNISAVNLGLGATITNADVVHGLGYTPYDASNPNQYLTAVTSAQIRTGLGYTPYNATNPSVFITASSLPTKVSQLTNDSHYATVSSVPTKTSQLANDNGFITGAQVPVVKGLGLGGESWNNVTGSRAFNTTYYNSRSYPIAVSASATCAVTSVIYGYVNGQLVSFFQWQFNGCGSYGGAFIIVPPGASYQLNSGQGVYNWAELY